MVTHLRTVSSASSAADIIGAMQKAVEGAIEGCRAEITGGGGHFSVTAISPAFEGKSRLEAQRMVLRAIKPLMDGANAPVHAIDSLITRVS